MSEAGVPTLAEEPLDKNLASPDASKEASTEPSDSSSAQDAWDIIDDVLKNKYEELLSPVCFPDLLDI